MARILTVGIATLDLIFEVDHYPREDEEMRARSLRVARGGNAANTAVVLAQLGHQVDFAGVLGEGPENGILLTDFRRFGVDVGCSVSRPGRPPTSSIYVAPTGSRTIVHYRGLPELGFADFAPIDLTPFHWIHFEGRNPPELARMIAHVRARRPGLPISLEVEKPREGWEGLLSRPDVLLCSQALARHLGYGDAPSFLRALAPWAPQAAVFVGWGSEGAFAVDPAGRLLTSPAFPPPRTVDTVGAGDTFNAGVIDGCLAGRPLQEVLESACRLAGRKCGVQGFDLA